MTWLYLPSQCSTSAPGSEASPSDSDSPASRLAQSAWWRGKPMPLPYWQKRWQRAGWIRHLSGLTSPHSMADLGVEQWISSLRDSHASRSALPVTAAASPTSDGSGPRSPGSSASADPQSSSSRTSSSTLFDDPVLTWQLWATASRQRSGSVRRTLARRINAIGGGSSLSLPTPTARDWKSMRASEATHAKNSRPLSEVVGRMFPTPTVGDSRNATANRSEPGKANSGTTLSDVVHPLGGGLNPEFVSWLMNVPTGVTNFDCSAMAFCLWLRQSRSIFCSLRRYEHPTR